MLFKIYFYIIGYTIKLLFYFSTEKRNVYLKVLTIVAFMYKLDRINRKLLVVLGKNARLSKQQIAHIVGTSRDVVQYRMAKLEKDNVIRGYIAHIANHKFGIENYLVLIKLQHMSEGREQQILAKICAMDFVKVVFRCRGDCDVVLILGAKNKIHLGGGIDWLTNICGRQVRDIDLGICVRVLKFEDYQFLLPEFAFPSKERERPINEEIDLIDRLIVKALATNARTAILDVAKVIGLSAEQTSTRLKRLLKLGVITGTQALLNFEKLGLHRYIVLLKLTHYTHARGHSFREFARQLSMITHAERLLGIWDLRVTIVSTSHEDFLGTLDRLRAFFGKDLSRYSVSLVLQELKRTSYPAKDARTESISLI